MTTIIIIVVVALVFFVTVCVVTFMVWKREAEMRTDSIREIKDNLQRLEDRLTVEIQPEEPTPLQDDLHDEVCRPVLRAADPAVAGRSCRSRAGAEIRSAGFAVNRRGKKLRRQKRSSRRSGRSRNLCNRQQKCR